MPSSPPVTTRRPIAESQTNFIGLSFTSFFTAILAIARSSCNIAQRFLTSRYFSVRHMDRAARAIEQWRRERPDLDVSPMGAIGRLNEASALIARDRLAPVFARFGLQSGEFDVLATLRRSGAPYALTPTELYEATMVTSGAMTARLDRLEKAGLIQRAPHPNDRRGVVVQLTGK